MNFGSEKINIKGYVDTAVLIFPDDAIEFAKTWIVVKQVDTDEKTGETTGVFYHIRKRAPEDPHGAMMTNSIAGGKT